eukprot:2271750-Pyramimonas_sp.AAC.1
MPTLSWRSWIPFGCGMLWIDLTVKNFSCWSGPRCTRLHPDPWKVTKRAGGYISVTGPTVDKIADVIVWWPPALGGPIHPRGAQALGLGPSARYPSNRRIVVYNSGKGGQFHEGRNAPQAMMPPGIAWTKPLLTS